MKDAARVIGLSVAPDEVETWSAELARAIEASGRALRLDPDAAAGDVDYLVYNIDGGELDLAHYTRARAVLNTWAGVEAVMAKVTWPDRIKFCRMAESGMTDGMCEYFVGHTLRYHLDIDRAQMQSAAGIWEKWTPPVARQRTVGVLGLGVLGAETARRLAALNFNVMGWSRSQKAIDNVACLSGADGLRKVLSKAEILILILPLTGETENLLNAERLGWMPEGAAIINAGRGPLIDDDALLAALASGQIRHATLDVFRNEPLPGNHPFWRHDQITVTPHIAAETRFDTAAQSILEQIGRDMDGAPLLHVVDRTRGY